MDRVLVGEIFSLGDLDRVDLADEVGYRDIRRRKLFGISSLARDPFDLEQIAFLGDLFATGLADRLERIVIDLASFNDRDFFVQQAFEVADQARLGLSPLAQENHVVTRQDRVFELRDDGVVVSDDILKHRAAGFHLLDEILAQLRPYRQNLVAGFLKLLQCLRSGHILSNRFRPAKEKAPGRGHTTNQFTL